MNSKKLITLLVLTTMLFAMVPIVPVNAAVLNASGMEVTNDDNDNWSSTDPTVTSPKGEKGHLIIIEASGGQVASGFELMIYWDKIQSWNGVKGLLNVSEAESDGGFEIWFDVPESTAGSHYIWITATDQETKESFEFTVVSDCDISSSSGLAGTKVTANFWGFKNNKEMAILFVASDYADDWYYLDVTGEVLGTGDALKVTFTGTAKYKPIVKTTFAPTDGTETFTDNGDGTLTGSLTGSGTIAYATGIYSITFNTAPGVATPVVADYEHEFNVQDETLDTGDGDETDFDDTLMNGMVVPGTFDVYVGATQIAEDDGTGGIDAVNIATWEVDDGSINYVTGEWSIEFTSAKTLGPTDTMMADYNYYDDMDDYTYVVTSTGVTTDLGSFPNRRITIPSSAAEGSYYVAGFDGKNNTASDDFEIGATITLDKSEGTTGEVVSIEGEGFDFNTFFRVYMVKGTTSELECHIINAEDDANKTDGDGDLEVDVIIPGVDKKSEDWEIEVRCGTDTPSAEYEVTGLSEVNIDPDFGPQGSKITVSGENFPYVKDTKVVVKLWDTGMTGSVEYTIKDDIKTNSDGTFSAQVNVPTENDGEYKIEAYAKADDDGGFNLADTTNFRIGTILVLLSDDEGEVGTKIVLTGNGFTVNDEWNATFGDLVIFEDVETDSGGRLKDGGETPAFFVPQVEPGVYLITVWDVDAELTVDVDFTVTEALYMEFDAYEAPNNFNVSLEGWNWPEVDDDFNPVDEIEWILYNETEDWDMDVRVEKDPGIPATFNDSGYYIGWWLVDDEDTLSKGYYWINATLETENGQEYYMQFEFTVGDVHESITPRKATFRIGETVTLNIQHSFGGQDNMDIKGGDVRVYDPDGSLYWDGDELLTWSKVGMYYTVPFSAQTAGGNPMVLLDDAPLGTWSYKWREDGGDVILSGTFNVEAAEADILGAQIEDLNSAIDDLTSDISSVTDAVAGVQTNINSAIQAANAAVDAANAATEAVNAVAGIAGDAATAAQQAAEAASDAKDAAGGLTTLVYGAIGASLVAALAAIVSLMQISRRIAG